MEKSAIRTILNKTLGDKYIYSIEYQDKYFLFKEIQEKLPDVSEDTIYSAIDQVNQAVKSPVKGRKFVEMFVNTLKI
ncbi:MAG: hypothetical protein ACM3S2_22140 [Ignavibacteriales bacterium]